MKYVLIAYIYAGLFAESDSVTMTSAVFESKETCEAAGKLGEKLVAGSKKEYRYICAKQ